MRPEQLQAELAIRELPRVAYVGWQSAEAGSRVDVQLVVTDPDVVTWTSDRARRILTRHFPDAEVVVDARVSGIPRTELLLERHPRSGARIDQVVALRGHRGELLRLVSSDAATSGSPGAAGRTGPVPERR